MLTTKHLILRDFIETDIEKRVYWETVETEWQLWDGPWEFESLTEEEKQTHLEKYIEKMQSWVEYYKNMSPDTARSTFQIVTKDDEKYIGWISSYNIDDNYNFTTGDGYCAIGIDFPDISIRGNGYSYEALCVFVKYIMDNGKDEIYIQTWSGNERMIHIAEKIGFEECCRKKDFRTVRGRKYDGLTFRLNMDKFNSFKKIL